MAFSIVLGKKIALFSCVLIFMSLTNISLNWVEHEKGFIYSGLGLGCMPTAEETFSPVEAQGIKSSDTFLDENTTFQVSTDRGLRVVGVPVFTAHIGKMFI